MQKKFIKNLLLVVAMVVLCFSVGVTASAAETYTEGYYTYRVENGKAIIVDVAEDISGDVVIPETLGGYNVTQIDYFAFYNVNKLNNVYIHKNIEFIGYDNFYSSGVKNFIVDKSNTHYVSVDGILYSEDMTTLVQYPAGREKCDFVVPASVTSIEHHGGFGHFGKVSFEEGTEIKHIGSSFSFAYIDEFEVPKSIILDTFLVYDDSFVYSLSFEERTNLETFTCDLVLSHQNAFKKIDLPKFFNKIDRGALYYAGSRNAEIHSSLEEVIIRNPECDIYDSVDTIYEGATIYGYENSTAQAYAEKYNRNFVALECEHSYVYEYVEADGCNCAYEYNECEICGDIKDKKEFPDTATHLYTPTVTSPTCTAQGYTTYTCSCGDSYVADYINALEHKDTNGDYKCDYGCGYEFEKPAPEEPVEPDVPDTPEEEEKNFFEKIIEWFKELFEKLFGWLKR